MTKIAKLLNLRKRIVRMAKLVKPSITKAPVYRPTFKPVVTQAKRKPKPKELSTLFRFDFLSSRDYRGRFPK